ncbi:cysteine proteinase [Aureobasidium pullulans]|uniref:Ubiquitin carboxyl-terminal hydrolase n=1 Tax=Aureobasidium pullulans TaxID=5580 RepID=A0A4S9RGX7_AURPU|nr:cysteine proteinase [Aureobasidium pullulans]THY97529.1 cysteine proteinase [Aureobasidium pullulans]
MSFFGKLKGNATPASPTTGSAPPKKDATAPQPTPLEKHLADLAGPVRPDGSDKFFGFENYGSTCYANSIIQCLYYSTTFRENVLNFPPLPPSPEPSETDADRSMSLQNGLPSPGNHLLTAATNNLTSSSPARRPIILPNSPEAQTTKPDDKDSPDYKKKVAMKSGPVLEMQMSNSNAYGMSESLFTSLKDIFESIIGHQSRTGIISPLKFLEILRKENEMFRSAMHQDAHEFLNLLLNQVVDNVEMYSKMLPAINGTLNGNGHAEPSMAGAMSAMAKAHNTAGMSGAGWVHDLFEGLLTSETRCLSCENTSQRDEAFMDLSVDLEAHSSVTACLRKFSEEEMLCERNKFHCDNCGGLQEAEKRMKIKRLPRILALHLKRFKYTEDLQRLQKLFHRVVYPYHLRLFNTTDDAEDPDRLYELYAVVVHIGGGPYHGHYVSIIKTQDRGWLMFDDELVEPVDKSFVRNFFGGEPKPGVQDARQLACAYVLFYQETTLEAMQREQEQEARQAAAAASMPNRDSVSREAHQGGLMINGLRNTHTVQSPIEEEPNAFSNLAHASTAPALSQQRSTFSSLSTSPFLGSGFGSLDKKAAKQAEKERKAQEKEARKLADAKRKEAAEATRNAWKKQNEDYLAAIELSKQTAAEEATRSGNTASDTPAPSAPTTSSAADGKDRPGLSRFRHSSMSLRQKPKFWASGKEKEAGSPMPTQAEEPSSTGGGEKEIKKNRFSLSRKKSTVL